MALNPTECGVGGSPPLRQWLQGTGISYIIVGAVWLVFGIFALCSPEVLAVYLIFCIVVCFFLFAWMIVGSVSLWRDGMDCRDLNYPIWAMGMAAVIISIVMCIVGWITSGATKKDT